MFDCPTYLEWLSVNLWNQEGAQAEGKAEEPQMKPDWQPSQQARKLRITNMQQWIDLNA